MIVFFYFCSELTACRVPCSGSFWTRYLGDDGSDDNRDIDDDGDIDGSGGSGGGSNVSHSFKYTAMNFICFFC